LDTTVVFWHDTGPVVEHPEASEEDRLKRFKLSVWLKNGVAKATPIKVEKSRELNMGRMINDYLGLGIRSLAQKKVIYTK
jgi:hypothetical protein